MYRHSRTGISKHYDFVILDFLALVIAFVSACLAFSANLSSNESIIEIGAISFAGANLLCILITENYKNILKRGKLKELLASFRYTLLVTLITIGVLFITKQGELQSRLQICSTFVLFFSLSFLFRSLRKHAIKKKGTSREKSSVLIITTSERVEKIVSGLRKDSSEFDLAINGICVIDEDMVGHEYEGVKVVANNNNVLDYACHSWVDEVFFDIGNGYIKPDAKLMEGFLEMGITTHVKLYTKDNNYEWERTVEKYGPYMVLTRTEKMVTPGQYFVKRLIDIIGGLFGTIITGILFIFIAPIIYIKSPGPVIFKQERIGKNGRRFKMYKFRSMVINADELKQQYMAQNRVGDGMMFKLDWDPRIIGNKELPDGKRKTGIGEFIRKTSLDEFPQFINVLKGDMSLVGTRPPTIDEWDKYDLHHRARMATRPGITGMWQISGRSDITDFEEVVRLDREYISKWSVGLDIKIMLKTVGAVLKHKGSM